MKNIGKSFYWKIRIVRVHKTTNFALVIGPTQDDQSGLNRRRNTEKQQQQKKKKKKKKKSEKCSQRSATVF